MIILDSIILLQFACGKLVSLVESESPLAPLREHTTDSIESKLFLGVCASLTPSGLIPFLYTKLDSINLRYV